MSLESLRDAPDVESDPAAFLAWAQDLAREALTAISDQSPPATEGELAEIARHEETIAPLEELDLTETNSYTMGYIDAIQHLHDIRRQSVNRDSE